MLPPVAKLTPAQVQYYFIQGYTAKVAGTEVRGEPTPASETSTIPKMGDISSAHE